MNKLPMITVVLAVICLLVAVLIKVTTVGKMVPGPMPVNWAKLTDTFLLLSIALSLLVKK